MPELPGPDSKHPARLAAWRSMDAVARGDKQAWLGNFADDAIVEDPVGESIIDPTGEAARVPDLGRLVIELQVAPAQPLRFIIVRIIQAGPEGLVVREV